MSNAIYPNSRYGASNPLPRGRQTPLETDGGTAYERVSEALQARWPQDETCGALDERRAYIAAKLWQLSRAPFYGLAAGADRYGLGMSKNELDAQTRDKRALQARSNEKSWWERRHPPCGSCCRRPTSPCRTGKPGTELSCVPCGNTGRRGFSAR